MKFVPSLQETLQVVADAYEDLVQNRFTADGDGTHCMVDHIDGEKFIQRLIVLYMGEAHCPSSVPFGEAGGRSPLQVQCAFVKTIVANRRSSQAAA